MRQQKRFQAGFSLVELLVAILVLAIGLLGLAELQITTMKSNAQGDSILVANHLAQKIIEEVAASPADDPRFTSDTISPQTWAGSPYDIPGAGVFNVTYEVATDYGGVEGLSQVTVHVASAGQVMNVLGMRQRLVDMATLKRTF